MLEYANRKIVLKIDAVHIATTALSLLAIFAIMQMKK